jgi:glycolate oxidase iron-sulfur subunit
MKAVEEGRLKTSDATHALDLCLDCRACEQACPSGVQYSRLLEPFRVKQLQAAEPVKGFAAWLQREVVQDRIKLARFLLPVRGLQKLGLSSALRASGRILPSRMRRLLEQLPRLQPREAKLPEQISIPEPIKRVGLFLGCAAEAMYPGVNRATVRVLRAYGCEVFVPPDQVCCGALPYHEGRTLEAIDMLATNAVTFGGLPRLDAIVVNAAGCGALLKEAGILGRELCEGKLDLHATLDHMAGIAQDINQFLSPLPPPDFRPLEIKAVYDDPCHLKHAQGISFEPRNLLQQIPKLELLDLPEAELCCGAAGSYALNQPEMSRRLGHRKARNVLETGADIVITSNTGCQIQLEKSLRELGSNKRRVQVMHLMEVLDKALPSTISR